MGTDVPLIVRAPSAGGVSIGDAIGSSNANRLLFTDDTNVLSDDGWEYVEGSVFGGLILYSNVQPYGWGTSDPAMGFLDLSGIGGAKSFLISTQGGTGSLYMTTGSSQILNANSSGLQLSTGATANEFSTDGTLGGNSDTALPTEKAVKTYADAIGTTASSYADAKVSDTAYGSGWNGVTDVAPSKNAVYDKIETMGGGTPAGSDSYIQYNDGGAFGGVANLTYNDTDNVMTMKINASQTTDILTVKDNSSRDVIKFRTPNATYSTEFSVYAPTSDNRGFGFRSSNPTSGWNLEAGAYVFFVYGTTNGVTPLGLLDTGRIGLGAYDYGTPGAQVQAYGGDSSIPTLRIKNAASQSANSMEVIDSSSTVQMAIAKNGAIKPASLADSAAENGTIYYSTDASKLVFKDSGGTVNNLY